MATKAAFIVPWSDAPNQHLSACARDLTRRQNNAKKFGVNITDDDKVTKLVACIYEANILKDSVMEKWEEAGERNWTNTVKHFFKEYGVVTPAAERAAQRAGFDSAAALREQDGSSLPPANAPPPAAPVPSTEDYNDMKEYAKALEQDNLELRSMGGESSNNHTSLSKIPQTTAISIATNAITLMLEEMNQECKETAAQMKHLAAMLLEAAKNKTPITADTPPAADGVFYNPTATRQVRHPPPKDVKTSGLLRGKPIRACDSCTNNWLTHADSECFELEANAAKRRPGWKSYFV